MAGSPAARPRDVPARKRHTAPIPRRARVHAVTQNGANKPAGAAAQPAGDAAAGAPSSSPTHGGAPSCEPWLDELLAQRRFTCTQCGKCCTGSGAVWLSEGEQRGVAQHLGMSLACFQRDLCAGYTKVDGWRMLRSLPNQDCVFLQDGKTCGIHAVRPVQCRTYPWWPELLGESDWSWERESVCEGFDHPDAPPTDVLEAQRQLLDATVHAIRRTLASDGARRRQAGGGAPRQGQGSGRHAALPELLGVMAAIGPLRSGGEGV